MKDQENSGIEMAMSKRDKTDNETVAVSEQNGKVSDPIEKAVGMLGPWQLFVCLSVFLLKFPVAFHQIGIIFLSPNVTFTCSDPTKPMCSDECPSHTFNRSIFTETIATEWDLVCEYGQLPNLSQTIFMLGILVGNFIFGTLADKFGRRGPLNAAVSIQLLTGVATAYAPSFWLFVTLRFLTGVVTGGTMVTSFVLVMEIIGEKYREMFSVLYQVPFNLGHLLLAGLGYYFRDWHSFQLSISIPSVILLSYFWIVPESPRWLLTIGRVDDAATVLEKGAKRNKMPTESIRSDLEAVALKKKVDNKPIAKGNFFDLLRTPNMRSKTCFMCFNWFVCGLTFFGLAQYISQLGGDIFTNVAVSALVELPGTLLSIYLMKRFGRRATLIGSNIFSGISLLLVALSIMWFNNPWAKVTLASAGMIGMSVAFPTVYLYGGELFPTVVRNIGIGLASMLARVGSMVAPFIAGLAVVNATMPPIIFGIIPLVGAALVHFLPETRGAPLPETIEDGELYGKKMKNVKH